MTDTTERLGTESIAKLIWTFSFPAIVGIVVNSLYNLVNRVYIGHSAGRLGMAAVTVGFPLMLVEVAFGSMVGIGAATLVSIRLGEQRKEEAEHIIGNTFTLAALISAVVTIVGLYFLDPILRSIGASAEVLPYARDFMGIILLGSVFLHTAMGMNAFIRAEGKPAKAMITVMIGTVMNIILAPIFLFVFKWGMKGAAWATVISQMISFFSVMSHFWTGKSSLRFRLKNLIPSMSIIRSILALGIAPFVLQLSASLQNVIMNKSLLKYGGDVAISGMGSVFAIILLLIMPAMGVSQGIQPIIGYNYGARNFGRVKETVKKAMVASVSLCFGGYLATRLFPVPLVSLFNGQDKELISFAHHALMVSFIFAPVIGLQVVCAGYYQAVGKVLMACFMGLSRQFLFLLPAMLLLPRFFGIEGVLYSFPVSDAIAGSVAVFCIWSEFKKLENQHQESLLLDTI
jgi:putative MATE family efflux protein